MLGSVIRAVSIHIFLLTIVARCQDFLLRPENHAGVAGSALWLRCRTENGSSYVSWEEYITYSDQETVISVGNEMSKPPNLHLYTVSSPRVGEYNLGVRLQKETAGRFRCHQLVPHDIQANLHIIVLKTEPRCWGPSTPSGYVALEGETVNMTCEISYYGDPRWAPQVMWTGPEGVLSDVNTFSSPGLLRTSIARKASPQLDGVMYTANVYFGPYRGTLQPDYASNPPSYTHTHKFPPITVQYPSRNIIFVPEQDKYNPGAEVECLSEGKLSVKYQWRNLATNETIHSKVLFVTEKMVGEEQEWQCEVTNDIQGGRVLTTTRKLAFKVSGSDYHIWVYSTLGLGALVLLIISAVVVYRCRKRSKTHHIGRVTSVEDSITIPGHKDHHVYNDIPDNRFNTYVSTKGQQQEVAKCVDREQDSWSSMDSYADMGGGRCTSPDLLPPQPHSPSDYADYANLDAITQASQDSLDNGL